jgi:hypothetical protein
MSRCTGGEWTGMRREVGPISWRSVFRPFYDGDVLSLVGVAQRRMVFTEPRNPLVFHMYLLLVKPRDTLAPSSAQVWFPARSYRAAAPDPVPVTPS